MKIKIGETVAKRLRFWLAASVISIGLIGCSITPKEILMKSQSEKTDVFAEVKEVGQLPKGLARLTIKASLKTHLEGYYIGESQESSHGKPAYPFLVNIDGQAAVWYAEGVKESKPVYDEAGKTSRDPEAGEGIKYDLRESIALATGAHKVFFGLPEDGYFVEVQIALQEGETAELEFKPIYRTKTIPTRIPTFLKGLDCYEVFLNGSRIM